MSRRMLPGGEPIEPRRQEPLAEQAPTASPDGKPAQPEAEPRFGPRIYVASLSDYNAGFLHGVWLDADEGAEAMAAGIERMLAESPATKRYGDIAEEYAIHDYEGWGGYIRIDEMESLETVELLATGLREHGEAFGVWAEHVDSRDPRVLAEIYEHYIGEYSSLEDFGEQQLEDMGFDVTELPGVPEGLRPYVQVDVAGWVRDMEFEGAIFTQEGGAGVYVFWT